MTIDDLIHLNSDETLLGWHEGVSNDDYHAGPGLSRSQIIPLLRSAAHFKHKFDNNKQTPTMKLGDATHQITLEPHRFLENCAVEPGFVWEDLERDEDGQIKLNKEKKRKVLRASTVQKKGWEKSEVNRRLPAHRKGLADWAAKNKKTVLKPEEFDNLRGITEALQNHPIVREFLAMGRKEVSGYWRHKGTGLLCRFRPDIMIESEGMLIDLKTTKDASYGAYQREIVKQKYDIQAAYYLDGATAVSGKEYKKFIHIAVENTPPYGIALYPLATDIILRGRSLYEKALDRFAACVADYKAHGEDYVWPSYPREFQTMELPTYANNYEE